MKKKKQTIPSIIFNVYNSFFILFFLCSLNKYKFYNKKHWAEKERKDKV